MTDETMTELEGTVVPEDDTTTTQAEVTTAAEDVATDAEPGGEQVDAAKENPFTLDEDVEDGEENGEEGGGGDEEEFVLEVPDGMELGDEWKERYASLAKEAGLPGGKAGKYISEVIKAELAEKAKQLDAQEVELRKEWGAKFNENVKTARAFARQIAGRAGVDMKLMQVFASPAGFKLMYALSQAVGEPGVVTGAPSNQGTNEAEAHRMITDPTHPLYHAFYNPEDPRYEEANRTYNKLVGLE